MPCYSPLQAFKTASGEVVFYERSRFNIVSQLSLPCGQCIGCRLERSRQWAVRCMHEASMYRDNSFITLTYDDAHLPLRGSLHYPDYQLFMKRLRKVAGPSGVRFYMCGEYGPTTWRPHYHACLFGFDFSDKLFLRTTESGEKVYESELLRKLWPLGHSSVGSVTFESAAYVARYCVQKVTGFNADAYYKRVDPSTGETYQLVPEFNHMSLKPGIGARWLDKYQASVYPHDYLVVRGVEAKPPKYYDRRYAAANPDDWERLQHVRELDGRARYEDNTPERLAVKAQVARARLALFNRSTVESLS